MKFQNDSFKNNDIILDGNDIIEMKPKIVHLDIIDYAEMMSKILSIEKKFRGMEPIAEDLPLLFQLEKDLENQMQNSITLSLYKYWLLINYYIFQAHDITKQRTERIHNTFSRIDEIEKKLFHCKTVETRFKSKKSGDLSEPINIKLIDIDMKDSTQFKLGSYVYALKGFFAIEFICDYMKFSKSTNSQRFDKFTCMALYFLARSFFLDKKRIEMKKNKIKPENKKKDKSHHHHNHLDKEQDRILIQRKLKKIGNSMYNIQDLYSARDKVIQARFIFETIENPATEECNFLFNPFESYLIESSSLSKSGSININSSEISQLNITSTTSSTHSHSPIPIRTRPIIFHNQSSQSTTTESTIAEPSQPLMLHSSSTQSLAPSVVKKDIIPPLLDYISTIFHFLISLKKLARQGEEFEKFIQINSKFGFEPLMWLEDAITKVILEDREIMISYFNKKLSHEISGGLIVTIINVCSKSSLLYDVLVESVKDIKHLICVTTLYKSEQKVIEHAIKDYNNKHLQELFGSLLASSFLGQTKMIVNVQENNNRISQYVRERFKDQLNFDEISNLFLECFEEDPLMKKLNSPLKSIQWYGRKMIEHVALHGRVWDRVAQNGIILGYSFWLTPSSQWFSLNSSTQEMIDIVTKSNKGKDIKRFITFNEQAEVLQKAHLRNIPSWTLLDVFVMKNHRKHGFGKSLLQPVLEMADSTNTFCFTITTNELNLPFFFRLGFSMKENLVSPSYNTFVLIRAPLKKQST